MCTKQSRAGIQFKICTVHKMKKENKFRNVQFGSILVHINVTQIDINQVEGRKAEVHKKKRYIKIDA